MDNIQFKYRSVDGNVTEVVSLEDAIKVQYASAASRGFTYADSIDAHQDLLANVMVSRTDKPIGITIRPVGH